MPQWHQTRWPNTPHATARTAFCSTWGADREVAEPGSRLAWGFGTDILRTRLQTVTAPCQVGMISRPDCSPRMAPPRCRGSTTSPFHLLARDGLACCKGNGA